MKKYNDTNQDLNELNAQLKQAKKAKRKARRAKALAISAVVAKGLITLGGKILCGVKVVIEFIEGKFKIQICKTAKTKPEILARIAMLSCAVVVGGVAIGSLVLKNNEIKVIAKEDVALVETALNNAEYTIEDAKESSGKDIDSSKTKSHVNTKEKQEVKGGKTQEVIKSNANEAYILGTISSKFDMGEFNPGLVVQSKSDTKYGIGNLSSDKNSERYVLGFFKYMNKENTDFYKKYFAKSGLPGSPELANDWKKAYEAEKDVFTSMQVDYLRETYIKNDLKTAKEITGVDFNRSLPLQELIVSTFAQYGNAEAQEILKESNLKDDLSDLDIINAIQDKKLERLGKNNYTDAEGYDDVARNAVKERTDKERVEYVRILDKKPLSM